MASTFAFGRAWPWWTATSCASWWSGEKPHDHPHPDDQHPRALLRDRGHRLFQHPGPGPKSLGLAQDPDVHDPRVRLCRSHRSHFTPGHLSPVRPVRSVLLWQLLVIQVVTFVVLAFLLH